MDVVWGECSIVIITIDKNRLGLNLDLKSELKRQL